MSAPRPRPAPSEAAEARTPPRRRLLQATLAAGAGLALPFALTGCAGAAVKTATPTTPGAPGRSATPAATPTPRATGDLALVIERATGSVLIVDTTRIETLQRIEGLGDLSHASVVFGRSQQYAYVFGRDGGLTQVDLLAGRIARRTLQAGNSIGGAISQDGRTIAVANYEPGGVRLFDAQTLEPLAEIPALGANGTRSKVVGLEDAPGNRFVFSLWEAGETWLVEPTADRRAPKVTRFSGTGRNPYDALVTGDGRWYLAGLFGEDGLALLDLWAPEAGIRRVLPHYGRGEQPLPVYKMPHLEGWAMAGGEAFLPAIGRHEVLVVDGTRWQELGRVPVSGQPVFAMARPDGREVWVNFAPPDNHRIDVIDVPSRRVVHRFEPGPGILHLEFSPRGEQLWLSVRDADRIEVYDTATRQRIGQLPAQKPSGIFMTARAHRLGL